MKNLAIPGLILFLVVGMIFATDSPSRTFGTLQPPDNSVSGLFMPIPQRELARFRHMLSEQQKADGNRDTRYLEKAIEQDEKEIEQFRDFCGGIGIDASVVLSGAYSEFLGYAFLQGQDIVLALVRTPGDPINVLLLRDGERLIGTVRIQVDDNGSADTCSPTHAGTDVLGGEDRLIPSDRILTAQSWFSVERQHGDLIAVVIPIVYSGGSPYDDTTWSAVVVMVFQRSQLKSTQIVRPIAFEYSYEVQKTFLEDSFWSEMDGQVPGDEDHSSTQKVENMIDEAWREWCVPEEGSVEARFLIGDVDEDGFMDIVFWRKIFSRQLVASEENPEMADDCCLRPAGNEMLVMRFLPGESRFSCPETTGNVPVPPASMWEKLSSIDEWPPLISAMGYCGSGLYH
jgi:hypothetical protein